VALDVTLTEGLKQEGIARDFVNRIQNLRKDMGLMVQDKITIRVSKSSEAVNRALLNFADYIQSETQAISFSVNGEFTGGTVLDMDEFKLTVKVEKISS
jgi:isoleucyl-tRNA synthetase